MTPAGIGRDETLCTLCTECVGTCPALAQEATGEKRSVAELMEEIEKDLPFFDESGGGVTFSGGEPLSQPAGLMALLRECQRRDIHRTVDTSGYAPTKTLLEVAKHANLFLYDLKVMDADKHRQYTGVDNRLILDNLAALSQNGSPVRVRIPLIAGINDDDDNINRLGTFVAGLRQVQGIDVLPYHASAKAKYKKLQLHYRGGELKTPDQERIQHVVATLRHYLADVHIGG
jgi:pyruvate formate lyase activating enzyme